MPEITALGEWDARILRHQAEKSAPAHDYEYWNARVRELRDLEAQPEPIASTTRGAVLDEAKGLITGDRNAVYGPPHQDFKRSADAANAYGYRGPEGRELQAHDIAILVSLVKISRLMWTPDKRDSWVDIAGYAACGYECVIETQRESQ